MNARSVHDTPTHVLLAAYADLISTASPALPYLHLLLQFANTHVTLWRRRGAVGLTEEPLVEGDRGPARPIGGPANDPAKLNAPDGVRRRLITCVPSVCDANKWRDTARARRCTARRQ